MFYVPSGLQILLELLHNVETSSVAQSFYTSYLLELIEHMFSVITDSSHAGSMFRIMNLPLLFSHRFNTACYHTSIYDECY